MLKCVAFGYVEQLLHALLCGKPLIGSWDKRLEKQMGLVTVKPERYRVIKDYKSPYPDPIVFQKGEKVKVCQEFTEDPDWENWVWCEGRDDRKAWVPKQYLDVDGRKGIFNRDYNAMELSVQTGEILVIHEIVNGFGMSEKPNGTKGWVPMRNMKIDESRWKAQSTRRH